MRRLFAGDVAPPRTSGCPVEAHEAIETGPCRGDQLWLETPGAIARHRNLDLAVTKLKPPFEGDDKPLDAGKSCEGSSPRAARPKAGALEPTQGHVLSNRNPEATRRT